MFEIKYKKFALIDSNNLIIDTGTSAHAKVYSASLGFKWIEVGETLSRHFNLDTVNSDKILKYKIENNQIVERTKQEIKTELDNRNLLLEREQNIQKAIRELAIKNLDME